MDVETVELPKTGKRHGLTPMSTTLTPPDGQTRLKSWVVRPLYTKVRTYQRRLARKRKVNQSELPMFESGYQATRSRCKQPTNEFHCSVMACSTSFTDSNIARMKSSWLRLDVKGACNEKKAKTFIVHSSVASVNLWNTRSKIWKTPIIADRFYPSTTRSKCGYVKPVTRKSPPSMEQHGTKTSWICLL